jgi:hypothetical protein
MLCISTIRHETDDAHTESIKSEDELGRTNDQGVTPEKLKQMIEERIALENDANRNKTNLINLLMIAYSEFSKKYDDDFYNTPITNLIKKSGINKMARGMINGAN